MVDLYLASASPRRAELLTQIGVPFCCLPVDIDETPHAGEQADAYVERLAREKATAAWQTLPAQSGACVLGADTSVVLDGRILGKPRDRADTLATLTALSGRTHQVLTAVALRQGQRCESIVVAVRYVFVCCVKARRKPIGRLASRATRRVAMPFRGWRRYSSRRCRVAIRAWWVCRCARPRSCWNVLACPAGRPQKAKACRLFTHRVQPAALSVLGGYER